MSTYITKRAKDLRLKKVDAKTPIVLGVTTGDIEFARKKNPECCALARACRREYPRVLNAYFFRSTAWLEYHDRLVRYVLPMSARKQIASFDRTKNMEPGAYLLDPPKGSHKAKAIKMRSEQRTGRHEEGDGKIKRKIVAHRSDEVRGLFQPKLLYLEGLR